MSKRGGLGRGLSALIPGAPEAGEASPGCSRCPSTRSPRTRSSRGPTSTTRRSRRWRPRSARSGSCSRSWSARPASGYELIAGERRLRAAKAAGLATVPVVLRDTEDADLLREALIENIHREDLGPIELAEAFRQLLEELGLKQEELAERVGVSRSHIANTIRLLQLPLDVQQLLTDGKIQAGHARALLSLGDAEAKTSLALRVAAEDLSVRETEELVRRFVDGPPKKDRKAERAARRRHPTGGHGRGRGDPVGAARDARPDPDGQEARPGR